LDVQEQIEKINVKIDQLMKLYEVEGIPPPPGYRLGDAEFMFRVVQLVQTDLVKEHFDLSDEDYDLLIKQKWYDQAQQMLKNTKKERLKAQAVVEQIAVPSKPTMFLPPGVEL
jgi:hypothetical protein